MLFFVRTGTAMKPIKIGNRFVVVIGRTAPANQKVAYREATQQRTAAHRIVLIRNGNVVEGRPGR